MPDSNEEIDRNYPVRVGSARLSASLALATQEPVTYRVAVESQSRQRRERLLQRAEDVLGRYRFNNKRLDDLTTAHSRGLVAPFVGAGLSDPCGLSRWGDLLCDLAEGAHLDRADVIAFLDRGEYEEAAEWLIAQYDADWFDTAIEAELLRKVRLRGPVLLLPDLFDGCLLTTNFDQVIEATYEQAGKPIFQRTLAGQAGTFEKALDGLGDTPNLFKVHGDVEIRSGRVLTRSGYDAEYGPTLDFSLDIPRRLEAAYAARRLLFLGCSLLNDRTVRLMEAITSQSGSASRVDHFAVLPAPVDKAAVRAREHHLVNRCRIHPIWYPLDVPDPHGAVEALLTELAERVSRHLSA